MVSLPPPPPPSGGGSTAPSRLVTSSPSFSSPQKSSRSGGSPKAGIYVSFGLALASTAASLALLLLAGDSLELRLLGYFLGGIVGPVALGIQSVSQRSALRDPNFAPMLKIGLTTKILVFAGIASAIVMVLIASGQISEYISETLEQAGWRL